MGPTDSNVLRLTNRLLQVAGVVVQQIAWELQLQHDLPEKGTHRERAFALAQLVQRRGLEAELEHQLQGTEPLAAFTEALRSNLDQLPDVFRAHGQRVLTDVYVALQVSDASEQPPLHEHDQPWWNALRHGTGVHLPEVLERAHRRWVLLGDPGSGKTTMVRQLALELLDGNDGRWPIFLRVASLTHTDLHRLLRDDPIHSIAADPLMRHVRNNQAVILLDGLDEHPDPSAAREIVTALAASVGTCPVIVTSRPIGYGSPSTLFADLRLCPLDDDAQTELLTHWVTNEARVADTLARLHHRPRMKQLAENPLLLTLVGLVLRHDTTPLPLRRSALYRRAVTHLVEHAREDVVENPVLVRQALATLAWALHRDDDGSPLELDDWVTALERHPELRAQMPRGVPVFLKDVSRTTAMLMPLTTQHGERTYAFPHRTVREFMAAVALAKDLRRTPVPEADAGPPGGLLGEALTSAESQPAAWAEVLALTCGLLEHGQGDALVRCVAAHGSAQLVARVVAEAEGIQPATVMAALGAEGEHDGWEARRGVLQQLPELVGDARVVVRLLRKFADGATHGADLWWAHHLLAEAAHGRCGDLDVAPDVVHEAEGLVGTFWRDHRTAERAQVLEQLQWREIPAGDFLMGSPRSEEGRLENEGPQHRVMVTLPFAMATVPVTRDRYALFDSAHSIEEGTHPATGITWYEASAFAAWLGLRLPTEVEWAYACRAGTTTRFSSGNSEADLVGVGWVAANGDRQAHPVGEKRANAWGLHDMHGNVWEWCTDTWDEERYAIQARHHGFAHDPSTPPTLGEDPGARRVIRGGSFFNSARGARSAFRYRFLPNDRNSDLGFRLVRAPTP